MSTGYSWEGIRQVRATLLSACRAMFLNAFVVAMSTWGAISSVRPLPLPLPRRTITYSYSYSGI